MSRISPARRLAAEFTGTAFLLATVVGSGIMAERLAGGNEAVALLGNTFPTGAILVVLITMFAPVSGARFNPAVTLAFAVRRDLSAIAAFAYICAQTAGALAGTWLAHLMFETPILEWGTKVRTGPGQWVAETVAAFGLMLTILLTLKARPRAVPAAVGLYIAAAYWFTASTSFANPAVTIARAFTNSFSGIRPADAAAFILAQFAGALLALGFAAWLLRPETSARSKARLARKASPAA